MTWKKINTTTEEGEVWEETTERKQVYYPDQIERKIAELQELLSHMKE